MVDLGSGAGTDSLIAAQMVGPDGHVIGVDMTPEMLAKARAAAAELGVTNAEFIEADAEQLPFADASIDTVVSTLVLCTVDAPDVALREIGRVLRPGGRIQLADVTIQRPVSEAGRRNIDLWTG